jgi:hypothetical protein
MTATASTLLIACGALARELLALVEAHGWHNMAVTCLPAHYHNTPAKIPEAVRAKIRDNRGRYDRILVVYGDCGTGGLLDQVLAEEGVERIAGPHCYQFYAGTTDFTAMMEAEPGSLFSPTIWRATSTASSWRAWASIAIRSCATTISATTRAWSIWRRPKIPNWSAWPRPPRVA